MTPTVLVPQWRITFPYTVTPIQHVWHMFCNVTASADPSGYDVVARSGGSNAGVSTVITRWWNQIKGAYKPSDASLGNAHLDHLVSGSWQVVWYEANLVVANGGSPCELNWESVISGYSTGHVKDRFYFKEGIIGGLSKATDWAGVVAQGIGVVIGSLYAVGGVPGATDPYWWRMMRDGQYAGAWISSVISPNKRLRRKRGVY